tara:strand:+ start:103 stop:849 length:747 start_codon:yes stop_codon:yes gene_type:complete
MAIGRPIDLTANIATKVISTTATASQTLFTVTGGYRINELGVFRNGIRLVDGNDYTARDGASVTLLTPATEGDVLAFHVFDSFNIANAIVPNESSQTIAGALTVTGDLTASSDVIGVSTRFTGAIGIESGGTAIGQGVTTLNFVGSGNTFAYDASSNTVDITISGSGGGGGGLGTAINYADGETSTPFSYIGNSVKVTENLAINTSNAGGNESYVVSVIPNVEITSGIAVTVGTGKTMIIDVLQIGDL